MAPTPEQERDYLAQFDKLSNEQIRHELAHGSISPAFVRAPGDRDQVFRLIATGRSD
jgi:hypothetical protein